MDKGDITINLNDLYSDSNSFRQEQNVYFVVFSLRHRKWSKEHRLDLNQRPRYWIILLY